MGGDIGRDSVDRLGPASRNRYHAILSVQVRGRRGLVCRPSHLTCATPALPSLLFPFPRTIGPSAWNLSLSYSYSIHHFSHTLCMSTFILNTAIMATRRFLFFFLLNCARGTMSSSRPRECSGPADYEIVLL